MKNISYDNSKNVINKPLDFFLRAIMSLIGVTLIALGAAFMRSGHVGIDPFTAMNAGMATKLGTSLGSFQLFANLVLFIIVLIFDRKQIGLGTIFNMVLVGYEIEYFSTFYSMIFPGKISIPMMIFDALVGILVFTLGTSIYMATKLGVSPYDALAPIISEKTHIEYRKVRSAQDIIFMIVAILVSGPFGIMTIFTAFFAGSLISFWNNTVSRELMTHIDHFSQRPSLHDAAGGLVSIGKRGYDIVSSAYKDTYIMQKQMSGYTNTEIEELIKKTNDNMRKNQQVQLILNKRLESLNAELKERKDKDK